MFDLVRPGFLLAGVLAALVPLLLHLIARHPPDRVPLPTLRFLRPDPRRTVRIRRRPSDPLLLLLRMLLFLLLGLGFAGLAWAPTRSGTAELVLLDRSTEGAGWDEAVDRARTLLLGADGRVRGALVVFDTAATHILDDRITATLFDSLARVGPGDLPPDYAVALRAIPPAVRTLGADSVRVTLLSDRSRAGWSPGLAQIRRAAWPGEVHIPELPMAPDMAGAAASAGAERDTPGRAEGPNAPSRAVVLAGEGEGGYLRAALEAAGWAAEVRLPGSPLPSDPATVYLVVSPPSAAVAGDLLERVERGATVIVAAEVPAPLRDALPWRFTPPDVEPGRGALVFGPGLVLAGATDRVAGDVVPDADVIAVWEDGRPAATARRGDGCLVFFAASLEGGSLPLSAAYPAAVDRLARVCERGSGGTTERGIGTDKGTLDSGAVAILRGEGLPPAVAMSAITAREGEGTDLTPWLLAAALSIAVLETLLTYRRQPDV